MYSLQEAERRMDLARVADLKYGALQDLDVAIANLEGTTNENLMLTETVGPDQISEVRSSLLFSSPIVFSPRVKISYQRSILIAAQLSK